MSLSNHGRIGQQVRFLQRQFLQDGESPFTNVLSEEVVLEAMHAVELVWKDRIYTPLVTLWVFLVQVLSQDHSCRAAVARLIAHRVSRGRCPCSAETGAYCQARKRLPEEFFAEVARKTGQSLENHANREWLLEKETRAGLRRLVRIDAEYDGESTGLSAASPTEDGR